MHPFVQLRCRYDRCQNLFTPSRHWQKFCSKQCKQNHHTERTKTAREQFKRYEL